MDHNYNQNRPKRKYNSNKMCSVPFCLNRSGFNISLHRFPSNVALKKKWATVFKMGKRIPKNAFACSAHFVPFDFIPNNTPLELQLKRRLKKCALPSLKLPKRPSDRRYLPPIAESPPVKSETPKKETLKVCKVPRNSTGKRNVIQERVTFLKRVQEEGERVEMFIEELYRLVRRCNYGELKDEMIRDRLIAGLQNQSLSETLQLEPDLTLEKTILKIIQSEEANTQKQVVNRSRVARSPVKKIIKMEIQENVSVIT